MSDGGWPDACTSSSGSVSSFGEWSDAEAEQGPVSSTAASCSDSDAWCAALRDGEALVESRNQCPRAASSECRKVPLHGWGDHKSWANRAHQPRVGRKLSCALSAAPADDGNARQIASTLLGVTAVVTSGQGVLVERYLPRLYSTCDLARISSGATRWGLEEGLIKPLPGVDCILYIDAARYDETPMLVECRGQSSFGKLLGTSASAAQPPAGEEGVCEAWHCLLVPLVNQSLIMNMLSFWSPSAGRSGCYL